MSQVKEVQERLGKVWQERKDYHDQLYDFHIFLRDANQLNNISSSQEVRENTQTQTDTDRHTHTDTHPTHPPPSPHMHNTHTHTRVCGGGDVLFTIEPHYNMVQYRTVSDIR